MRSSGGTKSGDRCAVTRATKSTIDFFVAPSFQAGRGIRDLCEDAACQTGCKQRRQQRDG